MTPLIAPLLLSVLLPGGEAERAIVSRPLWIAFDCPADVQVSVPRRLGEPVATIPLQVFVRNVATRRLDYTVGRQPRFDLLDETGKIAENVLVGAVPQGVAERFSVAPGETLYFTLVVTLSAQTLHDGELYTLRTSLGRCEAGRFVAHGTQKGELPRSMFRESVVQVAADERIGAGVIVAFDEMGHEAVILTAGELINRAHDLSVSILQKDGVCLDQPARYPAAVFRGATDDNIAILKCKLDYHPLYVPMAPPTFDYSDRQYIASGVTPHRRVTTQGVALTHFADEGLETVFAAPEEGWAGAPLFSRSGYCVGICWGKSRSTTNLVGTYRTLKLLREALDSEGISWP
jgi:hypothetical protein